MKTKSKAVTTTASTSTASATQVLADASTSTCFLTPSQPGVDSVGVLSISGTFTSALPVVEIKVFGGTVWLPVLLTNQVSLAQSSAPSPSNSTTTSWRFSCAGAQAVRSFCTSGTLTSPTLELTTGTAAEMGSDRSVLNNSVTSLQSFAAGFSMAGATGDNDVNLTDNLASAMDFTESTNSYLNFVTTNGAERVVVGKQMKFKDSVKAAFGDDDDITGAWDGTDFDWLQATANSSMKWGVDGAGIDQVWYGDTASANVTWDQSADQLIFNGVSTVSGLRVATSGATAITTTRAVTKADSGGVFTVSQGAAYTATVATPSGAGERYLFQLVSPGANNVAIVATGCTFEGTITIDAATIPATGSTLTFASGASVLGDSIELVSTSTTKFFVRAISSGAGGITIA